MFLKTFIIILSHAIGKHPHLSTFLHKLSSQTEAFLALSSFFFYVNVKVECISSVFTQTSFLLLCWQCAIQRSSAKQQFAPFSHFLYLFWNRIGLSQCQTDKTSPAQWNFSLALACISISQRVRKITPNWINW